MEAPVNYSTAHSYLRRHFPKAGQCIQCEKLGGRTEFALITGREYSRDRADYLELCVPCHRRYDGNLPVSPTGADHHSVKLTEAQVVEARVLRSVGKHTERQLARKYGISKTAMRYALIGRTWKHADADALLDRASDLFDAVSKAVA